MILILAPQMAMADDTVPTAIDTSAQSADEQWSVSLNGQLEYYSWTSTRGYPATGAGAEGKGTQVYMPIGFQIAGNPTDVLSLEFLVRSSYFWSKQKTAGMSGEASGTTDTSVSVTGTYYGFDGFQPFLALAANIPTGDAEMSGADTNSKMDSDIVDTPVFGEGFNAGLTLGGNIPLSETLVASVGAGYTNRGKYDRESFVPPGVTRIDPGDTYSFNAGLGFQGERLSLQSQLSYTGESETELNDAPYYQAGGSISASLSGDYAWSNAWSSQASFAYNHTEKNEVLTAGLPPLVDETLNSNSDVFKVDVSTNYAAETFTIGPKVGYVYRNENSWSSTDLEFLPAKTSWSLGLSGQYLVSPDMTLSADVTHFWLDENESPEKVILGPGSAIPEIKTRAWQVTLGGRWKF